MQYTWWKREISILGRKGFVGKNLFELGFFLIIAFHRSIFIFGKGNFDVEGRGFVAGV